jgi:hypothetical protein
MTMKRWTERDRRRRREGGTCTAAGCPRPARQLTTGNYEVFCLIHKERHDRHTRLNRLEESWAKEEK